MSKKVNVPFSFTRFESIHAKAKMIRINSPVLSEPQDMLEDAAMIQQSHVCLLNGILDKVVIAEDKLTPEYVAKWKAAEQNFGVTILDFEYELKSAKPREISVPVSLVVRTDRPDLSKYVVEIDSSYLSHTCLVPVDEQMSLDAVLKYTFALMRNLSHEVFNGCRADISNRTFSNEENAHWVDAKMAKYPAARISCQTIKLG